MLINSIPLLEAQASSEIENIVTTTDLLFRFANEPGNQADPATKEALRYRTALSEGFQTLTERPLSTSTAIAVCRTIKGVELDLYLRRYIIGNKRAYYDRLSSVTTDEEWEDWILFMLEAVRETANWSTARIRAIRDLLDQTAEQIRHDLPKIYSRELAEIIFVNPYCRIGDLVKAGIAKRQSASVYLKSLTEHGLLQEMKAGRENLYINPPLLALLRDRPPARSD